jgi:siroheme synthase
MDCLVLFLLEKPLVNDVAGIHDLDIVTKRHVVTGQQRSHRPDRPEFLAQEVREFYITLVFYMPGRAFSELVQKLRNGRLDEDTPRLSRY